MSGNPDVNLEKDSNFSEWPENLIFFWAVILYLGVCRNAIYFLISDSYLWLVSR
jgi:hypothetical protein